MVKKLFRRLKQRGGSEPRRRQRASRLADTKRLPEMLEKRLAMSVNTVFSAPGGDDPWTTVVTDYGSDVYFQHTGDRDESLQISNNASFRGTSELGVGLFQDQVRAVSNFNSQYDTLRVYEGESVQVTGPLRSTSYPDYDWGDDLTFVLPSDSVDTNTPLRISGTLTINGNAWDFEQINDSPLSRPGFTLRNGVNQYEVSAILGSEEGGLSFIRIENVVSSLGLSINDDISLTLTYDADTGWDVNNDDDTIAVTATDVLPAANRNLSIQLLPLTSGQQLLPGATRGSARLSITGRTNDINFVASPEPTSSGGNIFPVSFYEQTENIEQRSASFYPSDGVYLERNILDGQYSNRDQEIRFFSGTLNAATGVLSVQSNGYLGFEVSEVSTAIYDQAKAAATEAVLFNGFDHAVGLEVSLPSPNSRIQIDSEINIDEPRDGGLVTDRLEVTLAASTIEINSAVNSFRGFVVDLAENAPLGVASEELIIRAPLVTPTADIYLVERADTSSPNRSQLRVTSTGSITNDTDYFLTGGLNTDGNPATTNRVYVAAEVGDIIVDGIIAAEQHTYVMQSSADDNSRFKAPFVFSTGSFSSGVGGIVGGEVVVSLGNDIFGDFLSTTAFSTVSIDTQVDQLRVRAGSRRGDESGVPFPYELSVRENDNLTIDAVAASSRPIDISAGGDLSVSGAMRSGSDVNLRSDSSVQGRAPIETAFGTIEIEAPEVNLLGGVRVLDSIPDERRTDIIIRATDDNFAFDGSAREALLIGDQISAVNNVELISEQGSISGRGLVTADTLIATAAEDIILHTDVHQAKASIQPVNASVPGSTGIIAIYEEDYVLVDARNAQTVVLAAQGDDALITDPRNLDDGKQLSSALIATVSDGQTLFVTAPSGSIDVEVTGTTEVQLGNLDANIVETITTANPLFDLDTMLAAGSVNIVGQDALSMQVFDAPNALSGASIARFVTQKRLESVDGNEKPDEVDWSPGQPGFDRAELTFTLPLLKVMELVGFTSDPQGAEGPVYDDDGSGRLDLDFLDEWNQEFRESDLLLVKDGAVLELEEDGEYKEASNSVNGIYQIAQRSYSQSEDGTTLMTVQLVRLQSRDQTSEVSRTHYVAVAASRAAEKSYWVSADGVSFVAPSNSGTLLEDGSFLLEDAPDYTNIVVKEIDSRPGFTDVKTTTTSPIEGSYQPRKEKNVEPHDHYGRITSRIEQSIDEARELFGGVSLEKGDLVLVQFGTDQDQNPGALSSARTNGVFKVVEEGRNQNAFGLNGKQWALERYRGIDENGDGLIDEVFTGIAAVNQGRKRTSLTGKMFEYAYDAINTGDLVYTEIQSQQIIGTEGPRAERYQTRLDSGIEGAQIELTVSRATGGNRDGGTMGRMLNLLQQNQTERPMLLTFDTDLISQDGSDNVQIPVVTLTEALPEITRSLVIDGNNVVVDGSGIVADADGQELRSAPRGRYFGPVRPSEVVFARRQVLTRSQSNGGASNSRNNGLLFGKDSDGSIVRNLKIGGFEEGSAVLIEGADNILLDNVVAGAGEAEFIQLGKRLTNQNGIRVRPSGAKTGFGVTLRDVTVYDSTNRDSSGAGIQLDPGTQGVRIIESAIGSDGFKNDIGIKVGAAEDGDMLPEGKVVHQVIGVGDSVSSARLINPTTKLNRQPETPSGRTNEEWLVEISPLLLGSGLRAGMVAYDSIQERVWTLRTIISESAQATAVATLDEAGKVEKITLANSGNGYEPGTTLELEIATPLAAADKQATFTATVDDGGRISEVQLETAGEANSYGTPAQATVTYDEVNKTVNSIVLSDSGRGYKPNTTFEVVIDPPTAGDSAEQATATAFVDASGRISRIDLIAGGEGYETAPKVTLPLPQLLFEIDAPRLVPENSLNTFALLELREGDSWAETDNVEDWSAALEFGTMLKLEENSDVVTIPYGDVDFRDIFLGQEVDVFSPDSFVADPRVRLLKGIPAVISITVKGDGTLEPEIANAGNGYEVGSEIELIIESPISEDGEPVIGGVAATGHAVVGENGQITKVEIVDAGVGYVADTMPSVTVPPPRPQIELTESAAKSGYVFASFEVPDGRNHISYNGTGVELQGPPVRVVQTDIEYSIGAGIVVNGIQLWDDSVGSELSGTAVIEIGGQGVADGQTWETPDERNVAVFRNRGAGIVIGQQVFEQVGEAILGDVEINNLDKDKRDTLRDEFSNYVLIAGNYLGTDLNEGENLGNGTGILRNIGVGSLTGNARAFAEAVFAGNEDGDLREDHDGDKLETENTVNPTQPTDYVSLERYRALFRPEDFEVSEIPFAFEGEEDSLDKNTALDRAKLNELDKIRNRDSQSNLHGTIPAFEAPDNNPDDPVGGGGGDSSDGDDSDRNKWWEDFPTLR